MCSGDWARYGAFRSRPGLTAHLPVGVDGAALGPAPLDLAAANAEVEFEGTGHPLSGFGEPAGLGCCVGPGGEDRRRRHVVAALDAEARVLDRSFVHRSL